MNISTDWSGIWTHNLLLHKASNWHTFLLLWAIFSSLILLHFYIVLMKTSKRIPTVIEISMCETESSLSGEFVFHVWNQVGKKTFRRNKSLKEKNNWGVINVVIYTFSNLEKQIIFPLLWFTVRKKSRQTKKQTSPVRNTFELMSLHREAGTVTCVNNSHLASPLNHSTVWWTWVTRTLFTTNIQSGIWTHNLLHHKSLE